jgi:acyl-CoA reductase-like NAD-dependent aldehyde dehydrogenase
MSIEFTPTEQIPKIVEEARKFFNTGKTRSLSWRKRQLHGLLDLLTKEKDNLVSALHHDLHKPEGEGVVSEVMMAYNDTVDTLNHLDEWVKPDFPQVDLINAFDKCQIRKDPLGVVLIIGAWNYPVQLTLVPLVGAIAAGNAVILKPSEVSPHTAQLLANILPKYLDRDAYHVINGGVAETTALLAQRFDHILYTGNGQVAKIVMAAASKFLTPVTLELGGKSPAIVDDDVNVTNAARRIVWGRFLNAGQTCVAPDYVLVKNGLERKLIEAMKAALEEFYGKDIQKSRDFCRIVNKNHFKRLKDLIESAGGEKVIGGELNEEDRFIPPTVILRPDENSRILKDEIFGPVLPILTVNSIDEAIRYVNERDKPLALYVFSNRKAVIENVLNNTSSGGAVANDTLMHCTVPELPFGGVGPSGMGAYHGHHSFNLFSHKKSVMVKDMGMEFVNGVRYPPYTPQKLRLILALTTKKLKSFFSVHKIVLFLVLGLLVKTFFL